MSHETVQLGTTRQGYEVRVETRPDSIGFPIVERATATHPHTGVIHPVAEEHYANIRNILMSQQIAGGARAQADDALSSLTGWSERAIEAAMRYRSGGVDAHMRVHEALNNMAASLDRESQHNLDTLLHRIEKTLNGEQLVHEQRHGFADHSGEPQHGLHIGGAKPGTQQLG